MATAEEISDLLESMRNDSQARQLMRFFKTGKGSYGEGDNFLGLKVPQVRAVVKEARNEITLLEIEKLIYSKWHEVRLAGFLMLEEQMKKALPRKCCGVKSKNKSGIPDFPTRYDKGYERNAKEQEKAARRDEIATFFLNHARQANNWDLVDIPCRGILGEWMLHPSADGSMPDRSILDKLADSDNLWEQRISIVTTWQFIREGQFDDTMRLASKLLSHPHDLMHKAVGWMLREVGKKDVLLLTGFLEQYYAAMPRTTLRYAIERMPLPTRQFWLKKERRF